jgi:hypothetical protein
MGVLDDAIRDHLDLQRRRGADPAEIERAEREALGPVRRGPEPVADEPLLADALPYDDEEIAAPPFDNAPDGELEDDELWEDEFEPEWEDEPAAEHPPLAFEPAAEVPAVAPEPPVAAPDPRPVPEAIPEPHPAPAAAPAPAQDGRPAPQPASDETVEYRVEDALAHEGKDDDVLEETPEFLQDTPDHDRLWFEQRPPRDFDFDG